MCARDRVISLIQILGGREIVRSVRCAAWGHLSLNFKARVSRSSLEFEKGEKESEFNGFAAVVSSLGGNGTTATVCHIWADTASLVSG